MNKKQKKMVGYWLQGVVLGILLAGVLIQFTGH